MKPDRGAANCVRALRVAPVIARPHHALHCLEMMSAVHGGLEQRDHLSQHLGAAMYAGQQYFHQLQLPVLHSDHDFLPIIKGIHLCTGQASER